MHVGSILFISLCINLACRCSTFRCSRITPKRIRTSFSINSVLSNSSLSSNDQVSPLTDSLKKPFVSSKEDLFSSDTFKYPVFDYYDEVEDEDELDDKNKPEKALPGVVERNKKTTYIGKNPINRGLFGEPIGIPDDDHKIDVYDIVEQVDQFRFSFNLSSFEEALERKASLQARSIPIIKDKTDSSTEDITSNILLNSALLDRVVADAEVVESPDSTTYRLEVDPDELKDFIDQVDEVENELLEFSYSDNDSYISSNSMSETSSTSNKIDMALVEEASNQETAYLTELEEIVDKKLNAIPPPQQQFNSTASSGPLNLLSWRTLKTIKFQVYKGEVGLDVISMIYFGAISIYLTCFMDTIIAKLLNIVKYVLKLPVLRVIASDTLTSNALITSGLLVLMYLSFQADLKEQFDVTLAQYVWSLPFIKVLRFIACYFVKRTN